MKFCALNLPPLPRAASPALRQLRRRAVMLDQRDQMLTEWITMQSGDVPTHYTVRDQLRAEKTSVLQQLQNLTRLRA